MAEMTVAEAAVQWEAAKRAIAKQEPLLNSARGNKRRHWIQSWDGPR